MISRIDLGAEQRPMVADGGLPESFGGLLEIVRGYDRLYVLDGSIVPTSLGVNPSKTIAALAERGVERLAAERQPI